MTSISCKKRIAMQLQTSNRLFLRGASRTLARVRERTCVHRTPRKYIYIYIYMHGYLVALRDERVGGTEEVSFKSAYETLENPLTLTALCAGGAEDARINRYISAIPHAFNSQIITYA